MLERWDVSVKDKLHRLSCSKVSIKVMLMNYWTGKPHSAGDSQNPGEFSGISTQVN